jgi:hypothetical protein
LTQIYDAKTIQLTALLRAQVPTLVANRAKEPIAISQALELEAQSAPILR